MSREGGRTKGVGSLDEGKGEERAKKSVSKRWTRQSGRRARAWD